MHSLQNGQTPFDVPATNERISVAAAVAPQRLLDLADDVVASISTLLCEVLVGRFLIFWMSSRIHEPKKLQKSPDILGLGLVQKGSCWGLVLLPKGLYMFDSACLLSVACCQVVTTAARSGDECRGSTLCMCFTALRRRCHAADTSRRVVAFAL
jgi:hypothetical protein